MRKLSLILLATMICTLPSCVSIGMDEETKERADQAIAQIKRLNDSLESYQKDLRLLLEFLHKIIGPKTEIPKAEVPVPDKP